MRISDWSSDVCSSDLDEEDDEAHHRREDRSADEELEDAAHGSAPGAELNHLDAGAVANLLVTCGHHGVAGRKAAHHLNLARPAVAELDRRDLGAAVHHPVDEALVALGADRGLGHQQGVLAAIDDDAHARSEEHPSELQSLMRNT